MTTAAPRLRDDPDFRRYWLARALSITGSMVTAIALPVLVYRLSGSTVLTALVTALESAPYLLTGLFAGALADRWNRRRVMVSADLVNAVLVGSIRRGRSALPTMARGEIVSWTEVHPTGRRRMSDDVEEIRKLKARYFRLMDTKQWDELRGAVHRGPSMST